MDQKILWAVNQISKTDDENLPIMGLEEIAKARTFHESLPQYTKIPLTKLDYMTAYLEVKEVHLKDEPYRFGLNAFKALGGPSSMAHYTTEKTGRGVPELPHSVLTSDQLREEFGQATFFAATDGNHGCGAAWAINRPGQKAVVYMPKGSTQTCLRNIIKEGAAVDIQEMNYGDYVYLAAKEADETPRGAMAQDTVQDGYRETLSWIMQGHGTMTMEAGEQLKGYGCKCPTHIFVQADVGPLVGAAVGYFSNLYVDNPPVLVVVEAEAVAYLYKGAIIDDEQTCIMNGDMETTIAGLAYGEPNITSWDTLKSRVKVFIAAPDRVAAAGMCILSTPIKGDTPVTSGEPSATPLGVPAAVMSVDEYADLRKDIGPGRNPRALLFSTEGDTDPDHYKSIVWKGLDKQQSPISHPE